jgi:DNA processing protein
VEKLRLPDYSQSVLDQAIKNYDNILNANEKHGIKSVSIYDVSYPELYKNIADKPILLNYIGDLSSANNLPSVAVIGTREPSESGAKAAFRFGEIFGESGFNVVSGLAIGCDSGGHKGCLQKDGYTSAIMAHGLDQVYPKENEGLADRIIEKGGLLISEYFAGQRPMANYFVERDRLQAGLANGIIVVETDIKGGTMHTVRFAKANNRRIAAFNHGSPKMLQHPKSKGNQMLIREGTAFALGNKEEIHEYLDLLLNDYSAGSKRKPSLEKGQDIPNVKEGTQLNLFE